METNNKVQLYGEIYKSPVFSHELYGETFYEMKVACKRNSGTLDILPVIISERIMGEHDFSNGAKINAFGQFRSLNKIIDGKKNLLLNIFITEILDKKIFTNNQIELQGFICKKPIYRVTPFGREIADIMIAVNRAYGRSDYIPCIAWGRNAAFAKSIKVGEKIGIVGRIQSRQYEKKISDNEVIKKMAYEVSISKLYVG